MDNGKMANKMHLVAGYGRVSTRKQFYEGTSAEDQQNRITQECENKGWNIFKFYRDDAISGKNMRKRPAIQSLIKDARASKFNIVMFTKLDRVGRSLRELENFWHLMEEELGLELYCIDQPFINDPNMGKLMRGILGTFAQWESDLIKERMLRGRLNKWIDGETIVGKPPYGYKKEIVDGVIQKDEVLAKIVQEIYSLYIDQHYSRLDIAEILSEKSVPPPSSTYKHGRKYRAKRWNDVTVGDILTNRAYTGEAVYNQVEYEWSINEGKNYVQPTKVKKPENQWVTVKFEPIISVERFDLAEARKQQQKIKPKKKHKGHEDRFLVKGILYCWECGAKMQAKIGPYNRFYYACPWKTTSAKVLKNRGRERCVLKRIDADVLDAGIFDVISDVLAYPVPYAMHWFKDTNVEELKSKLENLKEEEKKVNEKLNSVYDDITSLEKKSELRRIILTRAEKDEEELKEIKRKIRETENEFKTYKKNVDQLANFRKDRKMANEGDEFKLLSSRKNVFKKFLNDLPFSEKKRLVEAVISPESGGRCVVGYKASLDIKPEFFLNEHLDMEAFDKTLMRREPSVKLDFKIDIGRMKALITSLNKKELLEEFDRDPVVEI